LFVRDVDVTLHRLHADDELAIVEATMTATLADDNHYANDYCFVFDLSDGLIHRVREYVDTARGHRMISAGCVGGPESTQRRRAPATPA
jgi:uncharacterized protein